MRVDGNGGGSVDYEPNSYGGPAEDPSVKEPPLRINGDGDCYVTYPCDDEDYYGQPRALWEQVFDEPGRSHLVDNSVASMSNPLMAIADPRPIQERMLRHWLKVRPQFGEQIADGLGLSGVTMAAE